MSISHYLYASGLQGHIYCDNRKILGNHELRNLFAEELVKVIKGLKVNDLVVGAMATGAIGTGSIAADRLSSPFIYIR